MLSKPTRSGLGPGPIPACAGIGLRAVHFQDVLETRPMLGWLEVHPENYFGAGGKPLYYLEQIRALYPLSLHGVGLSMGSTDPLNSVHLDKLKGLIRRFEPALVSEHVAWGSVGGRYHNDLLPLPYTEEALDHMVQRVSQVQDYLGRQILIENVSSYLQYTVSAIPEWEFVAELANRAGCGLLLDVNNIHVNACNHGFEAEIFLAADPSRSRPGDPLGGFYGQQPRRRGNPDRYPQPAGLCGGLGSLPASSTALRRYSNPDRVGCGSATLGHLAG